MFAASVYAFEWFFVKQADKAVTAGYLLHDFHCQLILVCGEITCCEDWSHFVLSWRNLVMFSFCVDSKLPEFFVQIFHVLDNARFDGRKVLVIHFLTFYRAGTKKCTSAHLKVFAFLVELFIN